METHHKIQPIDPKPDLLVFSKRELIVILILMTLVALFSFTIGLRLGKGLVNTTVELEQKTPPFESNHEVVGAHSEVQPEQEEAQKKEEGSDHHAQSEVKKTDSHAQAAAESAKEESHEESKKESHEGKEESDALEGGDEHAMSSSVEDKTDDFLHKELKKEKVSLGKVLPTTLPTKKKKEQSSLGSALYTIQVGSHRTEQEAIEQLKSLKEEGFEDAFFIEAQIPGKGTWYRVGIGHYTNKEMAENEVEKLKQSGKGMPSFIIQKVDE